MARPCGSVWRVAVALGLAVAVGGLAVLAGPTRPPGRSPGVQGQKKDKQKKRSEDEDDAPRAGDGDVTRIDDPDAAPSTPKGKPSGDLRQAARDARHPRVKALFARLAVPHDLVVVKGSGVLVGGERRREKRLRVAPLVETLEDATDPKGRLELQLIDDAGKPTHAVKVERSAIDVEAVRYHEQIAVEAVAEFLDQRFDKYEAGNPLALGRLDQILAGETALAGVLQIHQSAREREARKGPAWDRVEKALREALLKVKLMQLDLVVGSRSWDAAFDMAMQLADTFDRPEEHKQLAGPLGELLKQALADDQYTRDRMPEVRRRLFQVQDRFPDSRLVKPIQDTFRARAKALYDEARELVKQKQMARAAELLKEAEDTWPDLPGLGGYRLQVQGSYQILKVGMHELPRFLSPGWACTDAERRASELIFESLVSLTPDERGALYYRPGLAEGRPGVIPVGRRFKLSRQGKWSDGHPITVNDVQATVRVLKNGGGLDRGPVWNELVGGVQVEGDPFRFRFRLKQGLLDPFSAMSFKVLPARWEPKLATQEFAEAPVGSGPFRYEGRRSDASGREYAGFLANPHFGARPGRGGRPNVRELRIYAPADPVKDLKDDRIDMAADLSAAQAAALMADGAFEVKMPAAASTNRRIYFLAVNHRKPALANADLRLALGRAIHRDRLLDDHLRKGVGPKVHRAINGPYPAGSWACNPALGPKKDTASLDPFDAELAKTRLRRALEKLGRTEVALTVKYPAGDRAIDKALAAAIAELCEQVGRALPGVRLTPEARTPHQLREDVEQTFSYELAYYSYEFPDEAYWLEPLLASGRRGENVLGYTGSILSKVKQAANLRDFSKVREHAHMIHRQLLEVDMPLIPLWQLDPLIAVRKGRVEMTTIDPQALFTRVEEWRVRGGK